MLKLLCFQFFQRDRATFAAIPLQKLCDVNCLYFKRARHCFRFNLELPDPNSATGSGQVSHVVE